jgi:hypothetical protein
MVRGETAPCAFYLSAPATGCAALRRKRCLRGGRGLRCHPLGSIRVSSCSSGQITIGHQVSPGFHPTAAPAGAPGQRGKYALAEHCAIAIAQDSHRRCRSIGHVGCSGGAQTAIPRRNLMSLPNFVCVAARFFRPGSRRGDPGLAKRSPKPYKFA